MTLPKGPRPPDATHYTKYGYYRLEAGTWEINCMWYNSISKMWRYYGPGRPPHLRKLGEPQEPQEDKSMLLAGF